MNRKHLETPFNTDQIKHRKGNFNRTLAYIEAPAIITRLNEAFDAAWSFEIKEHHILQDEVLVLGKLTAEGIVKTQFGSSQITRKKDSGEIVSLGDDLKAAAQAAAMQLILERRINGHRVSDQVTFLDDTNRKTDRAGVTGILESVKSRFAAIIELEPDVDDWVKWAIQSNLPQDGS